MKLKNILIVVKDLEKAKTFYHDLFGLDVILDEKIWANFLKKEIVSEHNSSELYFEEKDLKTFAEKLERLYPSIQYVNKLMTHSCGHQVVRFYDLDGHLIEVRTPM